MLKVRSLRVQLSIWYVVFTMGWMSCIGLFSWLYLRSALAASREHTMEKREKHMLGFLATERTSHPKRPFAQRFAHYLEAASVETDIIQIAELNGASFYSTSGAEALPWPAGPCLQPCFGNVILNHHQMRMMSHVVTLDGRQVRLNVAGYVDEHYDIIEHVLDCYLIAFPMMLIASISGGFLLSRRALEPVDRITRDARTIGIHELSRRLPVPDTGDELQRLTETWNELLHRLETAVNRLTQFTSDISHDLRTSASVMLTTAQVALRRERTNDQYRKALGTIALECEATAGLLNDLLAIARAEVSAAAIEKTRVNLSPLLQEVGEQMRVQALVKTQQFTCSASTGIWVYGNSMMLRRLFAILMDNAIKYTPESGNITVVLTADQEIVRLDVVDTGIGIAEEDTHRVFERFFRADPARSRDNAGSGLGLSIARWIAETHGASIRLSSTIGKGSMFTFEMPQLDPALSPTPEPIPV